MEIISITNDKGGVGKTTTVVNLAVLLGRYPYHKRVLVIDLDGQTDASRLLGWDRENEKQGYPTIFTSLSQDTYLTAYESSYENVWLCPASPHLNDVEGHLRSKDMAVLSLRDCMEQAALIVNKERAYNLEDQFDYILIDCPPAMNLLTKNALSAANSILIPVQLEPLAVESLGGVLEQWTKTKRSTNPTLSIRGIVRCMEDKRLKKDKKVSIALKEAFGEYILDSIIPRSTVVPNSQAEHNATVDSDPYSMPSIAYQALANELFNYER